MKTEDFWRVILILLAGALLWFVVHVFWGHNEPRRNIDLGIHQLAPVDSRGYWSGDADAADTRKASFHRSGLALSVRPSKGESSLTSSVAKVRSAMACRGAHRLC